MRIIVIPRSLTEQIFLENTALKGEMIRKTQNKPKKGVSMHVFALPILLLSMISISLAGNVSGQLIYECPSSAYSTAYVVTMISFSESGIVGYNTAYPPAWTYSIDGEFSDDTTYFAIAVVPFGMSLLPGYPMGQYPNNPFRTTGGIATGIDIVMDDTADVNIDVDVVGAPYENIFVNIWDMTAALSDPTAYPVLEDTAVPLPNEDTNTISVASGLKAFQFFADLNANGLLDDDEPSVYSQNDALDTNFFIVGGGINQTVTAVLEVSGIAEKQIASEHKVQLSPNPFNSVMTIDAQIPDGEYKLFITDLSGRVVFNGNISAGITTWNAKDVPSGIYNVNIIGERLKISANALLIK